jgi:hypothetical protein
MSEIEDLIMDTKYAVESAYQRGLNIGRDSGSKIPAARNLLADFMVYIKKYRVVYTDFGISFADGDNIYSNEIIINNFLLTYDYDKE